MITVKQFVLVCLISLSLAATSSAMYDPVLGRFCSRDPIGHLSQGGYEIGSSNAITHISAHTSQQDGRPLVQVVHVEPPQTSTAPPCQKRVTIKQQFILPFAAPLGGMSYIIQRLTVTCGKSACPCDFGQTELIPQAFTIFEAFPIAPGGTMSGTDIWSIPPPPDDTCGKVTITGRAIYFDYDVLIALVRDFGERYPGDRFDPLNDWTEQNTPWCMGSNFSFGPSPNPPDTLPFNRFDFERFGVPRDDIPWVDRQMIRKWKCCCDKKDEVTGTKRSHYPL